MTTMTKHCAECGKPLTQDEEHYLSNACEQCELALHEKLDNEPGHEQENTAITELRDTDLESLAREELGKYHQIAFQQFVGQTFVTHAKVEINGLGDYRVTESGRYIYNGKDTTAAADAFNDALCSLRHRVETDQWQH